MSTGYIIEWFDGCWFSQGDGDPCRTLVIESAQVFKSKGAAKRRLTIDTKKYPHRDFSKSKIVPVNSKLEILKIQERQSL
ncbi:hypothetical protein ACZ98_23575 (plasmid) [Vibrio parahaemolyticus]|nr:hypothetical protein ACZ98_23575 [Vibrio parahaemolyticus]